ncbi:MAG: ABC transporter permease [Alphaproteobacteria bacterium]|nr:ABC transporter permease [Alphaproteobacteria bacterium]
MVRAGMFRLLANWRVALGGFVVLVFVVAALGAGWFSPADPLEQDLMLQLEAPSAQHLLGTDSLGRDILSRLIHGARVALAVALVAGILTALLGTALGLAAGYLGGWPDMLISRAVDIWSSFPPVLLSVILVALLGTGLHSVIVAIVVIDWTRFARVMRAETLKQRHMDYVDAAVVGGLKPGAILLREILPNVLPLFVVLLTLEMGIAVIVEAILSFVGLSLSSDVPTWGGMIAEGRQVIYQAPWIIALPMAALLALVLGLNLLGDGLKAELDPVLR